MKHLLLIPAFLLTAAAAMAQTVTHENDPKQERVEVVENSPPEIFMVVEEMPEFPGGPAAMNVYIEKNLQYPESAKKDSVSGNVYVKFIVDKNGEIKVPSVVKGLAGCSECNDEAIRVVKSMPKWKPGKQSGQNVPVYFNLAVRFKLDAPKKEVFAPVEVMPEFPGGPGKMMKFIIENQQYPSDLKAKGIEGKVMVRFVVIEDGSLEKIEVIKSSGYDSFDKEAVRVVSSMPKWKPGSQMGKPVKVFFNLPVAFNLDKRKQR